MLCIHAAATPCGQIWRGKGTTCCDPQRKSTLHFVTMLGTRGRGSASARVQARARAMTGAKGGSTVATSSGVMTATSLPSLVDRSRNVTTYTTATTPVHPRTNEMVPTTSATTLTNTGRSGGMSGGEVTMAHVHELCKGLIAQIKVIDGCLKGIDEKQSKLSDAVKELNDMMKKYTKESFAIKGTPREVSE